MPQQTLCLSVNDHCFLLQLRMVAQDALDLCTLHWKQVLSPACHVALLFCIKAVYIAERVEKLLNRILKGSEPASFSDFSTDQFYLTEGRHRRSRERRSCMALDRERMMELRRAQVLQQLSISCCAVHMRRQRYGRFCTSHHIGLRLSEENLHLLALLLRLPSASPWDRKAAVQMLPRGPPPPEWQERQQAASTCLAIARAAVAAVAAAAAAAVAAAVFAAAFAVVDTCWLLLLAS